MTNRNDPKREKSRRIEETRYVGAVPDEILEELTPEMIKQYYIWDEIMKREIELHPRLILPLIREVFHKTYPDETTIRLTATEYVVRRIFKEEGSILSSIYADIAVQIGKRDIYHLECQMNRDKGMVLRMLEYDIHISLVHGTEMPLGKDKADSGMEMSMPRSVILYLNHASHVPSEETCLIRFADGTVCEYHVPVMKVQDYSLKMIEEKHLVMLIPFLPIRFRKKLRQKARTEAVRKELTEFIRECIMIIEREKENGTLTELVSEDMMEFLSITCDYLFKNEPMIYKEVHEIMNPTIRLTRERADEMVKLTRERADEMIKLTREKADEMIKLTREKAAEEVARIEADVAKIKEEAEKIKVEAAETKEKAVKAEEKAVKAEEKAVKAEEKASKAEEKANKAEEIVESSIRNFIRIGQQNGQSFQKIREGVQEIFSLSKEEAGEQMKEYWKS